MVTATLEHQKGKMLHFIWYFLPDLVTSNFNFDTSTCAGQEVDLISPSQFPSNFILQPKRKPKGETNSLLQSQKKYYAGT
jgi:hypothetical protein